MIGIKCWDFGCGSYDPAVAQKVKASLLQSTIGKPVRFDSEYSTGDGLRRMVDLSFNAVRNPDGHVIYVIGSGIEITDRVQAETQNKETAARLESMCASAIDGIVTIDTRGVITSANPAAVALFGYSANEMIGQKVNLLMPEPWQRERDSYLSAYLETGEARIIGEGREVRGRRKNGTEFEMELQVSEAKSQGERIFVGTVRDITEHKRWETEIIDREAHLRRVINNQIGPVGVIDRDGILLEVDDRSLQIAQTRREVVIGKNFADAPWWNYDPAVAQQMRDAMQRAFAGEIVRYDVSLFSHGDDGVMIDFMIAPVFDDDGQIKYLIPSGVDIRDRYAAENRLKESESRFRSMANGLPLLVWVHDHEGKQVTVNQAFCDFYNVAEEQMRHMAWQNLSHPDDFKTYTEEFARCVKV